MALSKRNESILDIVTFVLHLAIVTLLIAGAGFMIAPLFSVDPSTEDVFVAAFFAVFAITIFVLDIKLLAERRLQSYLAIFGVTHTAMLLWCVIVSSYDTARFYAAYLALGIPLIVVKYGAKDPSRTPYVTLKGSTAIRIPGFIVVASGLLGACYSLLEFAGASLPYPDATPELLERQSNQIQIWGFALLANLFVLIGGKWVFWRTRLHK